MSKSSASASTSPSPWRSVQVPITRIDEIVADANSEQQNELDALLEALESMKIKNIELSQLISQGKAPNERRAEVERRLSQNYLDCGLHEQKMEKYQSVEKLHSIAKKQHDALLAEQSRLLAEQANIMENFGVLCNEYDSNVAKKSQLESTIVDFSEILKTLLPPKVSSELMLRLLSLDIFPKKYLRTLIPQKASFDLLKVLFVMDMFPGEYHNMSSRDKITTIFEKACDYCEMNGQSVKVLPYQTQFYRGTNCEIKTLTSYVRVEIASNNNTHFVLLPTEEFFGTFKVAVQDTVVVDLEHMDGNKTRKVLNYSKSDTQVQVRLLAINKPIKVDLYCGSIVCIVSPGIEKHHYTVNFSYLDTRHQKNSFTELV